MNILTRGFNRIIRTMARHGLISLRQTSILLYFVHLWRLPDLKTPRDLNEKLMWMQFNRDTGRWSHLADKYEVRNFIRSKGYGDLLMPLIGIYDDIDQIDFGSLPTQFVIKTTNGTAQTIIVEDKDTLYVPAVKEKIRRWLRHPFGRESGEKHYLDVRPRILIEERLPLGRGELPVDYKFMCFDGEVDSCLICTERDSSAFHCRLNLKDTENWEEISGAVTPHFLGKNEIQRPKFLKEMVAIAERLSEGFPFVRVDLYEVQGRIYFGELTFTPCACRIDYLSREVLDRMGDKITI